APCCCRSGREMSWLTSSYRHCEERSDEAIQSLLGSGLLRCARNDVWATSVQLLNRNRDTLADADAHGSQRPLAAALLHAVHRRHRKPRTAHAKRMAERDRAAMRVDEIGIFLDAELTQASDTLRGEGFIELDQIEVGDLQPQPLHKLARGRHRADAHDTRRHRSRGEAENLRTRCQA